MALLNELKLTMSPAEDSTWSQTSKLNKMNIHRSELCTTQILLTCITRIKPLKICPSERFTQSVLGLHGFYDCAKTRLHLHIQSSDKD
jgi:hypothetical protein